MTRATRGDAAMKPVTAVCAAMYRADRSAGLVPAYAFGFRVASTDTRFTMYARSADRYHIGEEYTLLLVPRDMPGDMPGDAVRLPLTVEDAEFLRHCLNNAAHRWREALTEADAAATVPRPSRPAEPGVVSPGVASPGHLDVEPTPAGYRAARRLFTDELDRVQRLASVLDRYIDRAKADSDGGQP